MNKPNHEKLRDKQMLNDFIELTKNIKAFCEEGDYNFNDHFYGHLAIKVQEKLSEQEARYQTELEELIGKIEEKMTEFPAPRGKRILGRQDTTIWNQALSDAIALIKNLKDKKV